MHILYDCDEKIQLEMQRNVYLNIFISEMGGISDHHISDNSSDSESDDEHKRMPIAAIHSPYQQYSSPHLLCFTTHLIWMGY